MEAHLRTEEVHAMATATQAPPPGADSHSCCTELIDYVDALEIMSCHDSQVSLGGSQLFALLHSIKEKAGRVMNALNAEVSHG